MNLNACSSLLISPENRVWFRAIHPHYWRKALAAVHTAGIPSRYSPGPGIKRSFAVLYLAEDHQVALFEVGVLLGSPLPGGSYVPNPRQSWLILNVQVTLQAVADLTNVAEHIKLDTTAQELTGDWRCYALRHANVSVSQPIGLAPTQRLSSAIHSLQRIEGFRAVSARVPTHMNLVVFPDRLRRNSSITFTHLDSGQTFTIGSAKKR